MLTKESGEAGLNFASRVAWDAYREHRKQGWGVEPVRCTTNTISSQVLTFNLFGDLARDKAWCARVLTTLLGYPVLEVHEAFLEWHPSHPSQYLGDKTLIDTLITYASPMGNEVLCVETKFTDPYVSRVLPIGQLQAHCDLVKRSTKWASVPQSRETNQLARVHLLAERYAERHGLSRSLVSPKLLLLHHELDTRADAVLAEYSSFLHSSPHHSAASGLSLSTVIRVLAETAMGVQQEAVAAALRQRYVDLHLSEKAWQEHEARSIGLRTGRSRARRSQE